MVMRNIGVLALQGSFEEHLNALKKIPGVNPVAVKTAEQLQNVERIILPGGESTTMTKLLKKFDLLEPLRQRIAAGMPVWGTCAGMILLAKNVIGGVPALAALDVTVRRNAYGGQLDSFSAEQVIPEVSDHPIPLVFIRAPWVESVEEGVEIVARTDGKISAVRQGSILASSFHPEMTDDLTFLNYFLAV